MAGRTVTGFLVAQPTTTSEIPHMTLTAFNILVGIALVCAVVSLIKPTWPLVGVAMILVCAALLIGKV